jgi:hypothetical protein
MVQWSLVVADAWWWTHTWRWHCFAWRWHQWQTWQGQCVDPFAKDGFVENNGGDFCSVHMQYILRVCWTSVLVLDDVHWWKVGHTTLIIVTPSSWCRCNSVLMLRSSFGLIDVLSCDLWGFGDYINKKDYMHYFNAGVSFSHSKKMDKWLVNIVGWIDCILR